MLVINGAHLYLAKVDYKFRKERNCLVKGSFSTEKKGNERNFTQDKFMNSPNKLLSQGLC